MVKVRTFSLTLIACAPVLSQARYKKFRQFANSSNCETAVRDNDDAYRFINLKRVFLRFSINTINHL